MSLLLLLLLLLRLLLLGAQLAHGAPNPVFSPAPISYGEFSID